MKKQLDSITRLTRLQQTMTQVRLAQHLQSQCALVKVNGLRESVIEVMDRGGIAWTLFPDLSNRHVSNLETQRSEAELSTQNAAHAAQRETRRLESLIKRQARLLQEDLAHRDNEARLESLWLKSASASRKVD